MHARMLPFPIDINMSDPTSKTLFDKKRKFIDQFLKINSKNKRCFLTLQAI